MHLSDAIDVTIIVTSYTEWPEGPFSKAFLDRSKFNVQCRSKCVIGLVCNIIAVPLVHNTCLHTQLLTYVRKDRMCPILQKWVSVHAAVNDTLARQTGDGVRPGRVVWSWPTSKKANAKGIRLQQAHCWHGVFSAPFQWLLESQVDKQQWLVIGSTKSDLLDWQMLDRLSSVACDQMQARTDCRQGSMSLTDWYGVEPTPLKFNLTWYACCMSHTDTNDRNFHLWLANQSRKGTEILGLVFDVCNSLQLTCFAYFLKSHGSNFAIHSWSDCVSSKAKSPMPRSRIIQNYKALTQRCDFVEDNYETIIFDIKYSTFQGEDVADMWHGLNRHVKIGSLRKYWCSSKLKEPMLGLTAATWLVSRTCAGKILGTHASECKGTLSNF